MTGPEEQAVLVESVRVLPLRDSYGDLRALGRSLKFEGLRHPITLWKDGTLISGARRHRAVMMAGHDHIQAVFVGTIEDAAKALTRDADDDYLALPWKWSEVCRLWVALRHLDEPAAAARAEEARRRGVELRRLTQSGKRPAGRTPGYRSEDYVLGVLAPSAGISETTAKRLWSIYTRAFGSVVPPQVRDEARAALASIDAGEGSISAFYHKLIGQRTAPVTTPRPVAPIQSAAAKVQLNAWDKSLPQMEGLVAGLLELGPPNADLTWDQVGPVHARLMVVRREIEKMIKQMREHNKS